jgi:hypothetical protein
LVLRLRERNRRSYGDYSHDSLLGENPYPSQPESHQRKICRRGLVLFFGGKLTPRTMGMAAGALPKLHPHRPPEKGASYPSLGELIALRLR